MQKGIYQEIPGWATGELEKLLNQKPRELGDSSCLGLDVTVWLGLDFFPFPPVCMLTLI